MKCRLVLLTLALAAADPALASSTAPRPKKEIHFAEAGTQAILVSSGTGVRFKTSAGQDTFYLYGGPGTQEGKFQLSPAAPDEMGHYPHDIRPGKWTGVDRTEVIGKWQVSDFCAETLDGDGSSGGAGDGPGNLAWWCGRTAEQEPGWATAPGYGNSWNELLEWRTTIANPQSTAQTVGLTFAFHHDTEPVYDFFSVEYDSSSMVQGVFSIAGSNAPFVAPGVQYPADVDAEPIEYGAGGYAGPNQDEIVLRLAVSSDGAWSDEDGMWPTICGAAIVDDITVTYDDGTGQTVVDFSDMDVTNTWAPPSYPFAGDFAAIHPLFHDLDPCRENRTPMIGFVDDGRCPPNLSNNGGEPPCESTGGSLSPNWSYGVPGGWVVNYTGGLSQGLVDLSNEIRSPLIAWDLPGSDDDGVDVVLPYVRFSVWKHLPLLNGIVYTWDLEGSDDGFSWPPECDCWFLYGDERRWTREERADVDGIPYFGPPTFLRLRIMVSDISSLFGPPVADATPSPMIDNVAVLKVRVDGPAISARAIDLLMDAFPQSGQTQFETVADRAQAGCRIDMRDINAGGQNVAGDSTIVDIVPMIPGTTLAGPPEMVWILDKNPLFDDVRVIPAGVTTIAGGALDGGDQLTGVVVAQQVVVNGVPVNEGHRWSADLYDGLPRSFGGTLTPTFAFPGEVIRWYWRAIDSDGRVTTLPRIIDAFATGEAPGGPYDPAFTVRLLPSVRDDGQGGVEQPNVLLINDAGVDDAIEHRQAFAQNGWKLGRDYDQYSVAGPSSMVGNGIGSSGVHGANADQLAGYQAIVYDAGARTTTLSDGTGSDDSNDTGVLQAWFEQDADRFLAHFGDDIASGLLLSAPSQGPTYLQEVMGVSLSADRVSNSIDGQNAPIVAPAVGSPWFSTSFVAYGGCEALNDFDDIDPVAGAIRSHEFVQPGGGPYGGPGRAASITFDRLDLSENRKVSITFPYGFQYVWEPSDGDGEDLSVRSDLLREILGGCFAVAAPGLSPTATPTEAMGLHGLESFPSPFNARLTVRFALGRNLDTSVAAYNLRGERVARLHRGPLGPGPQKIIWQGVDDRGVPVASGVYVIVVEAGETTLRNRVVLLK